MNLNGRLCHRWQSFVSAEKPRSLRFRLQLERRPVKLHGMQPSGTVAAVRAGAMGAPPATGGAFTMYLGLPSKEVLDASTSAAAAHPGAGCCAPHCGTTGSTSSTRLEAWQLTNFSRLYAAVLCRVCSGAASQYSIDLYDQLAAVSLSPLPATHQTVSCSKLSAAPRLLNAQDVARTPPDLTRQRRELRA